MIGIIFTSGETASANMAHALIAEHRFDKQNESSYISKSDGILLHDISKPEIVHAEGIDDLNLDIAYFLSRHRSAAGVGAFTTHSLGNWINEAKVGGEPKQLSFAAPVEMYSIISNIVKINVQNMEKTYEATHHGPLLKTPSVFVEVGGPESIINDKSLANVMVEAAYKAILAAKNGEIEYKKIVIGVGGSHYPDKFTRIATEKGYAFSHIMPKYVLGEASRDKFAILEQAMQRSNKAPEIAVVEWKSLNANIREELMKKLNELGLDYEKV